MPTLTPADYERIEWVKSFKSGTKWFLKLRKQHGEKPETQKNYALSLKAFCEYLDTNPDEIIRAYKAALKEDVNEAVEEWNDKLDLFVPWLIDRDHIKRSTAATKFSGVKSFFKYNVAIKPTALTPEFYPESYKPVTIDDLRDKILPFAGVLDTFEILFIKDSGISKDDALRINVGDIEDLGNGFGYMRMFRAKEGVDYETFIGPNAIDAMRKALNYRRRLGSEITKDSPLFVKLTKQTERQTWRLISSSWERLGKKAGVKISTHRVRKTFETYLAIAKIHPIILKYWMGHKVKHGKSDIEAKYIIPPKPEQLKAYIEGYKFIDITPQPNETDILLAEIRTRTATLPLEQRKKFLTEVTTMYRSRAHIIREDPKIKELLEETTIAQGGLVFGSQHEYEEINEKDLLMYLRAGWRITHNLQNGRLIIERW